ncbi:TIGR02710 family CRISPR-associated CARF protein [Methanomethylovorans sp.]|uniref:TIGR02710 family CRISPR-associated CARF protein n=1 Tax=Methanomethylovorans sp. TaxID=2758717 RepID=UPI00345E2EAE
MSSYVNEVNKRVSCIEDRQFILEKMRIFEESNDRNELAEISKELFPYEKKYMPCYTEDCAILICTVGLREAPIILSVLAVKPKKCILLHTKGSLRTVEMIEDDIDIKELGVVFERVEIDEVDASKNYDVMKKQVIERLREKSKVRVDPTGGRKIMGTAVGAIAFYFRIPMVYLHAEEKAGISVPFTGSIRDIKNPYEHYGDIDMQFLKYNFDHGYFNSALEICDQLRRTVHDRDICLKLGFIKKLTEIYRDWNGFVHSQYYQNPKDREELTYLSKRLESIKKDCERLGFELIRKEDMERNITFLNALENGWQNRSNIVDVPRIVDIYMNAIRRAEQELYDDAVARMYRCIEMCATLLLEKEGIENINKISKKDYAEFAAKHGMDYETLMSKFNELSNYKGSKEKLEPKERPGLNDQMMLLRTIDNRAAKIYAEMNMPEEMSESARDKRNRSILAHGTSPITKEDYLSIERYVKRIMILTIEESEFRTNTKQAAFPKLMI